jgi:hypothetical protein
MVSVVAVGSAGNSSLLSDDTNCARGDSTTSGIDVFVTDTGAGGAGPAKTVAAACVVELVCETKRPRQRWGKELSASNITEYDSAEGEGRATD